MRLGVSYYPELVPEKEWATDLNRMVEAGLDHLRILDFAWSAIEPREGEYHWEWLDRFIGMAFERRLSLILATPTASPPAWLARQYPDLMLHGRDRKPRPWGNRREGDVENPIYLEYCVGIAAALARRYGRHPAIIGWQLDNELVGSELLLPENHSPVAQWRFRKFLKRVHGDVQTLNRRWGMTFWNQAFSAWGEIDTPYHDRPCLGHWLDYQRHFSESLRDFLAAQAKAMRPYLRPGVWLSHNATAVFDRGLDHRGIAAPLDIVGWDAYPGAAAGRAGVYRPAFTALAHDYFRSAFHRPFWVFETKPMSGVGMKALVAESLVRGAEGVCFWHWRAHAAHVERGCSAFCDYAGRPFEDRMAALKSIREDARLHSLPGPVAKHPVAFWFDPDNVRESLHPNPYRRDTSTAYLRALGMWAHALRRIGVVPDVVQPGQSLLGYRLIIVPRPLLLSEEDGYHLTEAARQGAVVAISAPAAYYDRWGVAYPDLGAPLKALLGFTLRAESQNIPTLPVVWENDDIGTAEADGAYVKSLDGDVLARVNGGPWEGAVAAAFRRVGRGIAFSLPLWGERLCERAVEAASRAARLETHPAHENLSFAPDPHGRGWWVFNNSHHISMVGSRTVAAGEYDLIEKNS